MSGRLFIFAAGLLGAAGVAASAAAAHGGGGPFGSTIATMLLVHAPAFLALAAFAPANRLRTFSGWLLLAAIALFCADLGVRGLGWARLFPMAAPVGGSGMILGWLGIGASVFAHSANRP